MNPVIELDDHGRIKAIRGQCKARDIRSQIWEIQELLD